MNEHCRLDLGFTEEWITLKVVSSSDIERDVKEFKGGEDLNCEHFRWRRFVAFVESLDSMGAVLAGRLYALGESDLDKIVGDL